MFFQQFLSEEVLVFLARTLKFNSGFRVWCWKHWLACTEPWPQSSDTWDKLDGGLRPRTYHSPSVPELTDAPVAWMEKYCSQDLKCAERLKQGEWRLMEQKIMSVAVMRYSTITYGWSNWLSKNFWPSTASVLLLGRQHLGWYQTHKAHSSSQ